MDGTGVNGAKRRISSLEVHFISLVGRAANRRTFLTKAAEEAGLEVIEKEIAIRKQDAVRRMVYGIVYAPDEVDTEGDTMGAEEIAQAAYRFMQNRRTTSIDTEHDGETGKGFVAESWIVRRGDPVFPEEPEGAWAVGIKITDEETWNRVIGGELRGLSLAGVARAEAVEEGKDDRGDVEKGTDESVYSDDAPCESEEARDTSVMIHGDETPCIGDETASIRDEVEFVEQRSESVTGDGENVDVVETAGGQGKPGCEKPAGETEGGRARQFVAKIRRLLGITEKDEETGSRAGTQQESVRGVTGDGVGPEAIPFMSGTEWTPGGAACPDRREARLEKSGPLPIEKTASAEEIVEQFSRWLHLAMGVPEVERQDSQSRADQGLQFIARTSAGDRAFESTAEVQGDPGAVPEEIPCISPDEDLAARLAKVAEAITELARRIEQLEKSTTGRQTLLGGEDVDRGLEKGFKGVRIL